jgi:hypothetical protein
VRAKGEIVGISQVTGRAIFHAGDSGTPIVLPFHLQRGVN